ncbi:hypothetical protein H6P81_014468 [Aristolochia fimbriata]|uniref:PARP-type domain-containing protein n=1 Tax=Aristolochia fimbriata TaxID=158543 RepID=A0AAV7EHL5_ARIFI|nr:hypothetical protein H6P81_014468 [Aristolochia fimbriata]
MASSKVVAEYAKSNRSSCKKCLETILVNSLRLGVVTRDPRGFDNTKWHHVDCFPLESQAIVSAEDIRGFSSLKEGDQEALKKLEAVSNSEEEKVNKRVDAPGESEQKESKKPKLVETGKQDVMEIIFTEADVKTRYKDATLMPKWKAFQTLIFLDQDEGLHASEKIAAFDFDGCLVNTSLKRVGPDAWSLLYASIPLKLQCLYRDGYKLVIFTNESNIERWKKKRQEAVDSKIGRLNNFIKCVKVPIQVLIACGMGKSKDKIDDPFRKPKPGMWRIMEKHFNSGLPVNMDQSFYVGDAAGRPNDHSDADKKFAEAVGLKFYLPEEYFTN